MFAALTVPLIAVAPALAVAQTSAPAAGAATGTATTTAAPMKMKHHASTHHRRVMRKSTGGEAEQTRMLNEQQLNKAKQ
jgi:hypothetical protein